MGRRGSRREIWFKKVSARSAERIIRTFRGIGNGSLIFLTLCTNPIASVYREIVVV